MELSKETISNIKETRKVEFLNEKWEKEAYLMALMRATAWGRKIDQENKEYKTKHHLIDKYNV